MPLSYFPTFYSLTLTYYEGTRAVPRACMSRPRAAPPRPLTAARRRRTSEAVSTSNVVGSLAVHTKLIHTHGLVAPLSLRTPRYSSVMHLVLQNSGYLMIDDPKWSTLRSISFYGLSKIQKQSGAGGRARAPAGASRVSLSVRRTPRARPVDPGAGGRSTSQPNVRSVSTAAYRINLILTTRTNTPPVARACK